MLYIKLELRPVSLFKTKIYISCQKVYPKWENPSTFSPDFAPCCKRVWGCTALIWEPASCHRWGSTLVFLRTSYKESYTPRTRIHQKWSKYKDSMCCSTNLAITKMGEVLQQQHHHRQQQQQYQQHHQHSTTSRKKQQSNISHDQVLEREGWGGARVCQRASKACHQVRATSKYISWWFNSATVKLAKVSAEHKWRWGEVNMLQLHGDLGSYIGMESWSSTGHMIFR